MCTHTKEFTGTAFVQHATGQERNSNGAAEPLGGDGAAAAKLRDPQTGGGSREAEEGPPGPLVSNITKLFNCHSQHLNL